MQKTRLVIVGSGPAGYTAAIYAARAELAPVVITGMESGGQLMYTTELENFPGFPEGVIGPKFMFGMRAQASRFGALIQDESVVALDLSVRPFKLWTKLPAGVTPDQFKRANAAELAVIAQTAKKSEPDVLAESVIVTTGASSIMLGLPEEMQLLGKGLSTCAVCDAAFFRNKKVYVVGGGDSAMEDAMALAKFTDQVTMIHRRESFKASKIMQDRVLKNPRIKVLWNSQVTGIVGKDRLEKITVTTTNDGVAKVSELDADGLFLAVGHSPVTALFGGQLQLDAHGYIVTRLSLSQPGIEAAQKALDEKKLVSFPTMTNIQGVFAAGDVVDVRYKQAVTAAAMGCQAALDVEHWLADQSD